MKVIETLSEGLSIGTWDRGLSLINLDTAKNSLGSQEVTETLTTSGLVLGGLFIHDDTRDELLETFSGEEELSISSTVFLGVFNVNHRETLANGTSGLISS
jgi:hypothetical protein